MITKHLQAKTYTNKKGNIEYRISDMTIDSDGDVIIPSGVILDRYKKAPVVLFAHNYESAPIGRTVNISVNANEIFAEVEFAPTPFAQECKTLAENGFLPGCSVGFIGHKSEPRMDASGNYAGKTYLEWELLEWSLVSVGSNPNALIQTAKSAGYKTSAIEKEFNFTKSFIQSTVKNIIANQFKQEIDLSKIDYKSMVASFKQQKEDEEKELASIYIPYQGAVEFNPRADLMAEIAAREQQAKELKNPKREVPYYIKAQEEQLRWNH